jgi:hypothetical protein
MKRYLIVFFILLLIILLTIATTTSVLFYLDSRNKDSRVRELENEVQLLNDRLQNQDLPTPTPTGSASVTPTTNPCEHRSTDGAIVVTKPCTNERIASPVNVRGVATGLFEGAMVVELFDAGGNLIHAQNVTVAAAEIGAPAPFNVSFNFTPPTPPGAGKIKFYSQSAMDGSDIHVVEFAIRYN